MGTKAEDRGSSAKRSSKKTGTKVDTENHVLPTILAMVRTTNVGSKGPSRLGGGSEPDSIIRWQFSKEKPGPALPLALVYHQGKGYPIWVLRYPDAKETDRDD